MSIPFPYRATLGICLALLTAGMAHAIRWPINPLGDTYQLGNSYGEYQNYGGAPYFHPGIDIMSPAGTPVYTVKSGYVKAVLTTAAELHWRVAIGDSAGEAECDGWLYAHLDLATIAVSEGEWVNEGAYLGTLVSWPVANFHHLHFVKIRNSGTIWNSDWEFIGNPLDELDANDDPDGPVFENAQGSQPFALCRNESSTYFPSGQPIAGDVDVICRVYDYMNHYLWRVAPYRIDYRIDGDSSLPWMTSFCFTGQLDYAANVDVVYRSDGTCPSYGDYDQRVYYFPVTNTDGDSVIEAGDRSRSWQTADFHNGTYMVYVRAFDRAGNVAIDSMPVTVTNNFALAGTVTCGDGNPDLRGAIVMLLADGQIDTTVAGGGFSFASVGGGTQPITVARTGYETIDTVMLMNQARQLTVTLQAASFARGDCNGDGTINVGDAIYVVNYIFKGGPSPRPYAAGDCNSDGAINLGDAIHIVNYIFKGGPPPLAT